MGNFQVVYLTGAPASGKTTTVSALQRRDATIAHFSFGERLKDHINQSEGTKLSHGDIRQASAQIVTPELVKEVEDSLAVFVEKERKSRHVIIDSHPITKEKYGFRATPFNSESLKALNLTQIWTLYCSPEKSVERINSDAQGRQEISIFEAATHTSLQASVALNYSVLLGVPAYFFSSERDIEGLADELYNRLKRDS